MTSRRRAGFGPAALAAFVLCMGAAAGVAFAQEPAGDDGGGGEAEPPVQPAGAGGGGGGDLPPPEELNRRCPELAVAEGRRRDQLALLFFRLDAEKLGDEKQVAAVKAAFDPDKAEDVELLHRLLVQDKKPRCLTGLRVVLGTLGGRGAALLLQWYGEDAPESRARVLDGSLLAETQETYLLFAAALGDLRPVTDWAAQEAPPGYVPKRVADHAYRTLTQKLATGAGAGQIKLPEDHASGQAVGPFVKVEERDRRIQALREWIAGPDALGLRAYREALPSALKDLKGAELERAKKVVEALGK
ncbi:MAG: hypothetical protein HZA54_08545 [Planctomycetes bacterium]|nr:hypothetical protein [Planctomycetota bacterium]